MPKIAVLIVSDCFGADGSQPDADGKTFFHRKGTIEIFDDTKKADQKTLADLRAGGRIVPPVLRNLKIVEAELKKKKQDVPEVLTKVLEAVAKDPETDVVKLIEAKAK